jgi:hypothetical protein
MTSYNNDRTSGKAHSPPVPFKSVGMVALGDGASLTVQIGTTGGARVVNLRNQMRQGRAGTLPVGVGALVGADRIPDLIALLQRAVEPQAVAGAP